MKKKLVTVGVIIIATVIGIYVGTWNTERVYDKLVLDALRFEKSTDALIHLNILRLLRLGAIEDAIKETELTLDIETSVLTQKTTDPEELPEDVVRVLANIKTYRQIYPAQAERSSMVMQSLIKIPARTIASDKSSCRSRIAEISPFGRNDKGDLSFRTYVRNLPVERKLLSLTLSTRRNATQAFAV